MNSKEYYKQKLAFNKGFTLLEVMVALSVIAIVLVSIIRLQGQTVAMNETIRFYTLAPLLAQSKMSEITENPSNSDLSSSGDFGEDYSGYSWKSQIEDLIVTVPESGEINLKKIVVIVLLNDDELRFPLTQYMNETSGSGNE